MNTIPLIFNERALNLTHLGGREPHAGAMDVSVVMLSSGSALAHRVYALEQLQKCPFASIVSVEKDAESFNMEDLSRRFPEVRFIMPLEAVTAGDMINAAMTEAASRYVLVLRDTIRVGQNLMQPHFFERLIQGDPYCVVPRLMNSTGEPLPTQFVPQAVHGHFTVAVSSLIRDGMPTLYPFDFIGLYNREKFIQLGGFDYTITNPYYQNVDLGLRSWLWGERTVMSTSLLLSYSDEVPIEDTTTDDTYLHFYLKNIMPRYRERTGAASKTSAAAKTGAATDSGGASKTASAPPRAVISNTSFLRFLTHSSLPLFEARKMFRDARHWVEVNSARFHTDLQHLIENWDVESGYAAVTVDSDGDRG